MPNAFGVHLSPGEGGWDDATLDLAVSLGCVGVKIPNPSRDIVVRAARRFKWVILRPMPDHVHDATPAMYAEVTRQYVQWFREAGRSDAPLVQIGNEHNSDWEWGGPLPADAASRSARWYIECATAVIGAGGIPITTPAAQYNPMFPGGTDAWYEQYYSEFPKSSRGLQVLSQSLLGAHNYSHTHDGFTLNDRRGFQLPVWLHDLVLRITGQDRPVVCLESGTWPVWVGNDENLYAAMIAAQVAAACGLPATDPKTGQVVTPLPSYVKIISLWTLGVQPHDQHIWDVHDLRRHPLAQQKIRALNLNGGQQPMPDTWRLAEFRMLTACENHFMHNLFVRILDADGNPKDGVKVVVFSHSTGQSYVLTSGDKGPGKCEFDLWADDYQAWLQDAPDLKTPHFTTVIWGKDEMCNGSYGNSTRHFSYQATYMVGNNPTPIPVPPSSGDQFEQDGATRGVNNCGLTEVRGVVRDEHGRPLQGATVRYASTGGWSALSWPSDSEGKYNGFLNNRPVPGDWIAYIEQQGKQVSPSVAFKTAASCNAGDWNTVFVDFKRKGQTPTEPPAPPPVTEYKFTQGFLEYAKAHPELGLIPLSLELGIHPKGDVVCSTMNTKNGRRGMLIWIHDGSVHYVEEK